MTSFFVTCSTTWPFGSLPGVVVNEERNFPTPMFGKFQNAVV